MRIIYQDKEIQIESKKIKTTVKDFLTYLKPQLNSSPKEELILIEKKSKIIDKHTFLDDYTELDLEDTTNSSEYIIISIQCLPEEENTKADEIEKLIMLVTNAKDQLKPVMSQKKKISKSDRYSQFLKSIYGDVNFPITSQRHNRGIFDIRDEVDSLLLNPNDYISNLSYNQSNVPNSINNNSGNLNVNIPNNNIPNSNNQVRPLQPTSIEPNPSYIQNLINMGFPEDRAKRALIASRNNLNHATEMILNDNDHVFIDDSNIYEGKIK